MNEWMEVFKAGDYGPKGKYDAQLLDQAVRNYNPALHEAPLVIGHPEHDKPAFGWVAGLRREGNTLLAKVHQVQPAFNDLVQSGAFKKRSVAFYQNLEGKGLYLRHVGFLGAVPPEIKGLQDLRFLEGEFVGFEFGEESPSEKGVEMDPVEVKKTIKESVAEFFSELLGKKPEQAEAVNEDRLKAEIEQAVTRAKAEFASQVEKSSERIVALETELANARKSSQQTSKQARIATFIEGLAAAGKFPPAFQKDGLVVFLESLNDNEKSVTFGEGEQKQELSQLDFGLAFLEKLPEIVPFGEVVTAGKEARGRRTVKFTEGRDVPADPASVELAEAAKALAQEKNLTFGEALRQVRRLRSGQ